MLVKRFAEAKPYEAPNHWGVVGLRLQGFEPGGPTNQWVGFSQFLPGGGAGPDSTPFEKVYVVLSGRMTPDRRRQRDRARARWTPAPSPPTKCASSSTATTTSARCWSSFPILPE